MNYFDGIDDEIVRLQNRIMKEIDLDKDTLGHSKMNIVRDSFETIQCAMHSINSVMNIGGLAQKEC